ncbi:MAG: thiamine phosphate synthase [Planctomycetota bacterium]
MNSQYISNPIALLRILDAAANRAREGLRVIEDWARFALDDAHLTECLKQIRHDLAAALACIPWEQRLAARETQADVGTGITTPSEHSREKLSDVLMANFLRLQESLRSLEEFGKIINPTIGCAVEQIRYRTYTVQRAIDSTRIGLDRLATARLYVLLDGQATVEQFERMAQRLIEAGVDLLQLRDKRLADRELIDRARRLRRLTRDTQTLLVINDRPDLAALTLADGVHVGQEELSVKDARSIVGPDALIGVSTHSIEQARQAVLDGANYIGVGPTFPSGTKQFDHFPGVELLRAVAAEIRLPAFAIGGITRENMGQVKAAGFVRVAVRGAITGAESPVQAVREIREFMMTEK